MKLTGYDGLRGISKTLCVSIARVGVLGKGVKPVRTRQDGEGVTAVNSVWATCFRRERKCHRGHLT